jgi:hypothetical protein
MTLKIKRSAADPATPPVGSGGSDTPPVPSAPATRVRPLVPPRAPSSAKNKSKVLLSVLDGKIEWEKMTAESRKSFEDLFKDKEFLSQFGLTGKEKLFDPKQIKQLYDGISMMYRTVVGFMLRWPEGALKMLSYTDEQKEMLAEPTAKLANKFAPAFLVQHQELIIWFSLFGFITQKNFLEASTEAKKLSAVKSQPPVISRGPNAREVAERAAAIIQRPNSAPANQPAPEIQVPFSMPTNGDASDSLDSLSLES